MKRIRNYRMSKGRKGNLRHKNLGHLETGWKNEYEKDKKLSDVQKTQGNLAS